MERRRKIGGVFCLAVNKTCGGVLVSVLGETAVQILVILKTQQASVQGMDS